MKPILLNAFQMNTVGHHAHGMWTHPRDRSRHYNELGYWLDLARTLEVIHEVPCFGDGLAAREQAVIAQDHRVVVAEIFDQRRLLGRIEHDA